MPLISPDISCSQMHLFQASKTTILRTFRLPQATLLYLLSPSRGIITGVMRRNMWILILCLVHHVIHRVILPVSVEQYVWRRWLHSWHIDPCASAFFAQRLLNAATLQRVCVSRNPYRPFLVMVLACVGLVLSGVVCTLEVAA